jgi:hypothetical protein
VAPVRRHAMGHPESTASGGVHIRPCENAKVLGFRVSLDPSRVATKPIQCDLKGRFFRRPHEARVFTRPRPVSVIREGSVTGGCQSHSGRLLIAVQTSNWGAWLTQFARN